MSTLGEIFPQPETKTKLGHYHLLSPTAAVRVSPLCLGAMNFGNNWKGYMGECTKDDTFKVLDAFYEAGGNFIDTANNYQFGESEEWIGEWMEKRGNRNEIVLATKFTTIIPTPTPSKIRVNNSGNSKKTLRVSLEHSLKRLRTDYIDLLYVHWWDYTTTVEELMTSLNHLVASGKVLYLGISDTPAWVVAACNTYAKDHGLAQFVVYQGRWNALQREFERDIIPMCRNFGLGLAPWNVLNAGKFARLPEPGTEGKGRAGEELSEADKKVLNALAKVAKELNATVAQIAIAYVINKVPYTTPIVGGRKPAHLQDNIKALDIKLTASQLKAIEDAAPVELGFPHDFIGSGVNPTYDSFLLKAAGVLEPVEPLRIN